MESQTRSLLHLALAVRDEDASRRFYETYFGFEVRLRAEDGVLLLRNHSERFRADGVEIVEEWDEPDYVSVKVRHSDGYVVEVAWDQLPTT